MTTRCPSCNFDNCYNSGFHIECWNKTCKFFTEKQFDAVQKLLETKKTPAGDWISPWTAEDEKRLMEAFEEKESAIVFSGSYSPRKGIRTTGKKPTANPQLDLFSCNNDDSDDDNNQVNYPIDYSDFLNERDSND